MLNLPTCFLFALTDIASDMGAKAAIESIKSLLPYYTQNDDVNTLRTAIEGKSDEDAIATAQALIGA